MLPGDPVMLLSVINTKLRDEYSSLAALAEDMGIDQQSLSDITKKLEAIGYTYNSEQNKFV